MGADRILLADLGQILKRGERVVGKKSFSKSLDEEAVRGDDKEPFFVFSSLFLLLLFFFRCSPSFRLSGTWGTSLESTIFSGISEFYSTPQPPPAKRRRSWAACFRVSIKCMYVHRVFLVARKR